MFVKRILNREGCVSSSITHPSFLLPFVPVFSGGEEEIVGQAVQLLRVDEQLSELEPLLAFFASFVLPTSLVQ